MQLSPFRWEQSKLFAVSFLFMLSGQRVDLSHMPVGSFKRHFEDIWSCSPKEACHFVCVSQNCWRTKRIHVDMVLIRCPLLCWNSTDGFHRTPSACCTFTSGFHSYCCTFSFADEELRLIRVLSFWFCTFPFSFCIIDRLKFFAT